MSKEGKRPKVTVIPATIPQKSPDASENPLNSLKERSLQVAAYCRVSSKDDMQSGSLETQKDYYLRLISDTANWKLVGIYADFGLSGLSIEKRPEFKKLLRKCRKKQVELVITKSVSRFSRNTVDCLTFVRELKELGVAVFFEKENINTMEVDGEFALTVFCGIAQMEAETMGKNIAWGRRVGMQAGKVAFGKVYGFQLNTDRKPEIIPAEAEVVRRMFRWFVGGNSLREIGRKLEAENILSPTGKNTWSVSTLSRILQNEKYIGNVVLQKTFVSDTLTGKVQKNQGELPQYIIENHHKAIVSKEIFEEVQENFGHRGKESTGSGKFFSKFHSSRYALSDSLVCHYCGSSYVRKIWCNQNGKKTAVWRCKTRVKEGVKYCENSVSLKEIFLKEKILMMIQEHFPKEEWNMVDYLPEPVDKQKSVISPNEMICIKNSLISLLASEENNVRKLEEIEQNISRLQRSLNKEEEKNIVDRNTQSLYWNEDFVRHFINRIVVRGKNDMTLCFVDGKVVEIKG